MHRTCTVCKKRPAVYYRRYSGDYLCEKCLSRTLERTIHRSLASTKKLEPNSKILLPITFTNPVHSLILSKFIPRIESEYNVETIIAVPQYFYEQLKNYKPSENLHVANIAPPSHDVTDPFYCWRYDRAWSIKLAKNHGAQAIVLPLTRTDLNLLMLEAVLRGQSFLLSESLPILQLDSISIISGAQRAEGELLAAYLALNKDTIPLVKTPCRPDLKNAKLLFYSVAVGRPELEFSSFKSISLLTRKLPLKNKVCSLCGGYSDNGDICSYCRSYLETINSLEVVS